MKPGRNDPCPCGSGKKFKHCCGRSTKTAPTTNPAAAPQRREVPTAPELANAFQTAVQHYQAARLRQAEVICRQILQVKPKHPDALHLLGVIALQARQPDAAVELLRKAVALAPNAAKFHYTLGIALKLQDKLDEARTNLDQALRLKPDFAEAHYALANVFLAQQQPVKAIASYHRALALKPNFLEARYNLIRTQLKICDWSEFGTIRDTLLRPTLEAGGQAVDDPPDPSGIITLPLPVTPAEQQTIARVFVRNKTRMLTSARQSLGFAHKPGPRKRLRIGYISSDFRDHPTAYLMQGLFGRHDRRHCEIFGYSLGRDDGCVYRQRIVRDCDQFRDVSGMGDVETAEKIYQDHIDILVDLNGHTMGNRIEVLALRPAPVQVSYLGYPSTVGADFLDYIMTDRITTPPDMQPYFDEAFVYLPDSYQVNDLDRVIVEDIPSRAACGLPTDAFVFCCFNQSYKIGPMLFDAWGRILRRVEGSVLWLLSTSDAVETNLRREAEQRGVSGARLVFAKRVPPDQHLSRHRQADLFLDTTYYNAHTTASDALWTGLPVLTCPGNTFASRVCTSLLHAVGLPELSVPDLTTYENTAVRLASQRDELERLKRRLEANRLTSPLFDAARFARSLEKAYRIMWDTYQLGESPGQIEVKENGR